MDFLPLVGRYDSVAVEAESHEGVWLSKISQSWLSGFVLVTMGLACSTQTLKADVLDNAILECRELYQGALEASRRKDPSCLDLWTKAYESTKKPLSLLQQKLPLETRPILQLSFRQAECARMAGLHSAAIRSLEECASMLQSGHSGEEVEVEGKRISIASAVDRRMIECQNSLSLEKVRTINEPYTLQFTSRAGPSSAGGLQYSADGQIIFPQYPSLQEGQLKSISQRRCRPGETSRAKGIASEFLSRNHFQFQPIQVICGDIVFVAVDATQTESKERSLLIQQWIEDSKTGLAHLYFTKMRNQANPPMYFYAYYGKSSGEADRLAKSLHIHPYAGRGGYFQPLDNSVLIKNGRAWGTHIHELVHGLIYREYPQAPHWLDEGMAAFYENTSRGKPMDNYRLYYVLEAQNRGLLPSLLTILDDNSGLWREGSLLGTGCARYLFASIGERSMSKIYQEMRDNAAVSPEQSLNIMCKVTGLSPEQLYAGFLEQISESKKRRLTLVHGYVDSHFANPERFRSSVSKYVASLRSSNLAKSSNGISAPLDEPGDWPLP